MTRNGHGGPGGLAVMPATAPERAGKVVYGDGSWQLTIFVTDLQVQEIVDDERVNLEPPISGGAESSSERRLAHWRSDDPAGGQPR